ncbi:MAG TPA: hypothetical protein VFQ72_00965 [Candidatus Paceibacterota bacterium]|nr:hypothetical protein [Candidatus Paceibacterota bacterium]
MKTYLMLLLPEMQTSPDVILPVLAGSDPRAALEKARSYTKPFAQHFIGRVQLYQLEQGKNEDYYRFFTAFRETVCDPVVYVAVPKSGGMGTEWSEEISPTFQALCDAAPPVDDSRLGEPIGSIQGCVSGWKS